LGGIGLSDHSYTSATARPACSRRSRMHTAVQPWPGRIGQQHSRLVLCLPVRIAAHSPSRAPQVVMTKRTIFNRDCRHRLRSLVELSVECLHGREGQVSCSTATATHRTPIFAIFDGSPYRLGSCQITAYESKTECRAPQHRSRNAQPSAAQSRSASVTQAQVSCASAIARAQRRSCSS
jgi:hypothetical protein